MAKRSLIAVRTKAIRAVREALRGPGTMAFAGNLSGIVQVPGRPTCIYARLTRQPAKVIVAQVGAAPPAELETLRGWLIEVKQIVEEVGVRYRVVNWLEDALGRPVSEATYSPARHYLDPALGVHIGSLDSYYFTEAELSGKGGAALIGIEDEGDLFQATNVEDALQEVLSQLRAGAYRHAFSDEFNILFDNPYTDRPAITVHFNTTIGFGTQAFGTSVFGGIDYWTQQGPLATEIESIAFPPGKIRVKLAAAASGEVLCVA